MNDTILYTVVIPHYNIPELLERCLQSIPVKENIQVIVVDDCSPNAADYICDIPALSRPFVEFYSTPEGGSAGRARNVGIEHAKGRWITFLDADDLFVPEVGEILERYKDRPEDLIFFQAKSVMSNDLSKPSDRNLFKFHFEEYFRSGNDHMLRFEFDVPWGKFIKKSFIDAHHLRFEEVRYSNDTLFSAKLGVFGRSIFVAPEILYIVTERSGSLTAGKVQTTMEWETRLKECLKVQTLLDKNHVKHRRYAFADFFFLMWQRSKRTFFTHFFRLSFRNQLRYLYCYLRAHRIS